MKITDNPKEIEEDYSFEKVARLADISNNTTINIEADRQDNMTIDTLAKKVGKNIEYTCREINLKYMNNILLEPQSSAPE